MSVASFDYPAWLTALPFLLSAATLTWLLSLPMRNVSFVNPLWSLLLFMAGVVYALGSDPRAPRLSLVLWLLAVWALRLAFVNARDLARGEHRHHQDLRARMQRGFAPKSLVVIFWWQAGLAWIVSLPLLGAFATNQPLRWLDALGVALWCVGFAFEVASDRQLRRFRDDPASGDRAPEHGLWRYTRRPDYFGEFCLWWGFGLFAFAAGAWWAAVGPLVLSWLLMRAAGVPWLADRGGNDLPQAADYVLKTNAFFPGPPRK